MGELLVFCIICLLALMVMPNNRLKAEKQARVLAVDERRNKPLLNALNDLHMWKSLAYGLILGILFYICIADNSHNKVYIVDQEGIKRLVTPIVADSLIRNTSAYISK